MTVQRRLFGVWILMCTLCWCTNFNLRRVLIWWVIDNRNWSKTRHIFDVASYWLRDLIKNSSCDWYGEFLITEIDRKLVIDMMWRVIKYDSWSKNSSCDWYGEFLITEIDQKLIIDLMWRVIDYVIWSKTRHVIDMVSFW